jgi:hypothetical protein
MRVHGLLVRPFGEFVSGQMISFAVGGRGGGVGVSRKVVEFCGSIVSALRHGYSPGQFDIVIKDERRKKLRNFCRLSLYEWLHDRHQWLRSRSLSDA